MHLNKGVFRVKKKKLPLYATICFFPLQLCLIATVLQVEKICKVAKKPLVVTYTGLIQTCIDSGSMENAKYIFNEMCNYCSPNNVTCNIMLKSYIDHGMFEDAKILLGNILSGRIQSKGDSGQQAIADKFTFNTFMDACAEAKKWNDFEYAFRKMLSNGYHFEERRHLRMVLDAYRNGKVLISYAQGSDYLITHMSKAEVFWLAFLRLQYRSKGHIRVPVIQFEMSVKPLSVSVLTKVSVIHHYSGTASGRCMGLPVSSWPGSTRPYDNGKILPKTETR
jgi:pentatricopeptide repeat protein